MASQKSPYDIIEGLTSKIGTEDIVFRNFEIPQKKIPVSKKAQPKQKSITEKAFAKQEKGIKDALKLF